MFFKDKIDFEKIKAYCRQDMLGNLIRIFNENRFDILYGSPIERMTWHGLQQKDKNNDGKKTQKQFMRLVNNIIKLPDQPASSSEKTLFDSFQQDMTKSFQIIFNKDLTQLINNGDQKILSQHIKGGKLDSVATLLERIGKSINLVQKDQKLNHQNQKEISQYRDKVKSYTKHKIVGRYLSIQSYTSKVRSRKALYQSKTKLQEGQ